MRIGRKPGIAVLAGLGLFALIAWRIEAASTHVLEAHYAPPPSALHAAPSQSSIRDGERLAHLNGCFACHGQNLTGKVTFRGFFGTRLVAPNLTRVLRRQSDTQIAAAIRYGIKADGTSTIAMPSDRFIGLSDTDVAAMIAYLRSLPERPDATAKTQWGFIGRAMLAMKLLPQEAALVDRTAHGPVQTPATPLALGGYIARSQCSVCHDGDLSGDTLEASPDLHFAIKHYSPAAFAHFFRSGEGQIGHGTKTMTKMIESRFRYLTDAEVRALYATLNTPVPPR